MVNLKAVRARLAAAPVDRDDWTRADHAVNGRVSPARVTGGPRQPPTEPRSRNDQG